MEGWSVALLVAAAYVAVSTLVRFMLARRNALVVELREQAAAEQRRKKKEARKKSRKEAA